MTLRIIAEEVSLARQAELKASVQGDSLLVDNAPIRI
jgi:hypothetical protein